LDHPDDYIKIPNGCITLIINNAHQYNEYNKFFDNLPLTLKILEITNLAVPLTNLPVSLDKVIINNYTEEVKEKSVYPIDCNVQYIGSLIEKYKPIKLTFHGRARELFWPSVSLFPSDYWITF
jgi:hypothetical protein